MKLCHVYGVEIYEFVQFDAGPDIIYILIYNHLDPDNNLDVTCLALAAVRSLLSATLQNHKQHLLISLFVHSF